ncbi:MAG: hypothetical protein HY800_08125, partial [Ignavibacteriales bacterium]|nr:hypothetical protein [Ignavibacteriales bacterium]
MPVIHRHKWVTGYLAEHKFITLVLVTAIVVSFIYIVTRKPTNVLPLEPSEYILVAKFENLTNNRIFDHSLTEAIKVSLRQSARLNIFPSERIAEALKRMKMSESQPLNDTTAVAVAQREGVRVVVAGGISPVGTNYVLSSKIIDAVTGEMIRLIHREVTGIEKILSAMDQLCEDIRKSLGETTQEIS